MNLSYLAAVTCTTASGDRYSIATNVEKSVGITILSAMMVADGKNCTNISSTL